MKMEHLSCCLCSFDARNELELETHIDLNHSEIFKLSKEDFNNKVPSHNFAHNNFRPAYCVKLGYVGWMIFTPRKMLID